jgi:hypothetical protein
VAPLKVFKRAKEKLPSVRFKKEAKSLIFQKLKVLLTSLQINKFSQPLCLKTKSRLHSLLTKTIILIKTCYVLQIKLRKIKATLHKNAKQQHQYNKQTKTRL